MKIGKKNPREKPKGQEIKKKMKRSFENGFNPNF
jgi:hypothetical protein